MAFARMAQFRGYGCSYFWLVGKPSLTGLRLSCSWFGRNRQ